MEPDPLLDRPWWAATWLPNADDEPSVDRLRRVVWVVLAAGLLAFIVRGADEPADPSLPSERGEVSVTTTPAVEPG